MSIPNSYSLKRGVVAMAAAFSLMAAATPTQAAVIASFDPIFGPTIPYLAFNGTTTFDVSRGCYAAAPAQGGYVQTSSSCVVTATAAEINYYNYTEQTGILSTVDLDGTYFPSTYVTDVLFDANNQVAGFDTSDSARFQVSITEGSGNSNTTINYFGSMLLFFTAPVLDPAFLVDCNADTAGNPVGESQCSRGTNANSFAATVTFQNTDLTAVPEPGTISLSLIGLGAVAASRRRRDKASTGRRLLDS